MYELYKELLAGGKILVLITLVALIVPMGLFNAIKQKQLRFFAGLFYGCACVYLGLAGAGYNVSCVEACRAAGTYTPGMVVMIFFFCIVLMLLFAVKGGLAIWVDIDNGPEDGNRVAKTVGIFGLFFLMQFVGLIVFLIHPDLIDLIVPWASRI